MSETNPEEQARIENRNTYYILRQEIITSNRLNMQKYDHSIITLSTAMLGLSIAFIKGVVPFEQSRYLTLLIFSWCMFGGSIISTLISFLLSPGVAMRELEKIGECYLGDKEKLEGDNSSSWINIMNYLSGILFIFGIIATIIFVSINSLKL